MRKVPAVVAPLVAPLVALLVALLATLASPRIASATEPDATDVAREEYARGNALARGPGGSACEQRRSERPAADRRVGAEQRARGVVVVGGRGAA